MAKSPSPSKTPSPSKSPSPSKTTSVKETDIISAAAKSTGMTATDVKKAVEAYWSEIISQLAKSGLQKIELGGVGVIEERQHKAGSVTPPGKTAPVSYPAYTSLSMRFSTTVKDALAGKSKSKAVRDIVGEDEFDDFADEDYRSYDQDNDSDSNSDYDEEE